MENTKQSVISTMKSKPQKPMIKCLKNTMKNLLILIFMKTVWIYSNAMLDHTIER